MKNQKLKIILGLTIAIIACFFIYIFISSENRKPDFSPDGINYNPPTKQEVSEAESHKKDLVDRQKIERNSGTSSRREVKPVIVDASQYDDTVEVSAFIQGVTENGGMCIFKFSKSGQNEIHRTLTGLMNASTTSCPLLELPVVSFSSKGIWNLTVGYSSDKAYGESQVSRVEVK